MNNDPKTCQHEDLDRVGAYQIVCFGCQHMASISDLLKHGIRGDVWKPITKEK